MPSAGLFDRLRRLAGRRLVLDLDTSPPRSRSGSGRRKEDLAAFKRRATRSGVGYTTLTRLIWRAYLRNPLIR